MALSGAAGELPGARGKRGSGPPHGGCGVERRIRFLEPVTVALLTGHRRVPPYGMAGGGPGTLGSQHVERADGGRTPLKGCDTAELDAGDVLVLRTPGGGGTEPRTRPATGAAEGRAAGAGSLGHDRRPGPW